MQDVSLYELMKFYAKNWLWIVSLTFAGLVAGFVYSNFIQTPLYKSDATLLLVRSSFSGDSATQDTVRINNYIELFKSRRVLEPVADKLNLKMSYDEMVGSIEANSNKNTEVIKISMSTNSPETSKRFIEGAVSSFKEQVSKLYKSDNINIVDGASLAAEPYNINKVLTIAMFSVVGFISAVIVLFFVYDFRFAKGRQLVDKDTDDDVVVKPVSPVIIDSPVEVASVVGSQPITPQPRILSSRYEYARERQARR